MMQYHLEEFNALRHSGDMPVEMSGFGPDRLRHDTALRPQLWPKANNSVRTPETDQDAVLFMKGQGRAADPRDRITLGADEAHDVANFIAAPWTAYPQLVNAGQKRSLILMLQKAL